MSKIKDFFKHDEIKIALMLGFCIILLAYVSRRILHVEFSYLDHAMPGIVVLIFESLKQSKKIDPKYLRVLYWNLAILASALIVILFHLL
jgi:hypothetical protein